MNCCTSHFSHIENQLHFYLYPYLYFIYCYRIADSTILIWYKLNYTHIVKLEATTLSEHVHTRHILHTGSSQYPFNLSLYYHLLA